MAEAAFRGADLAGAAGAAFCEERDAVTAFRFTGCEGVDGRAAGAGFFEFEAAELRAAGACDRAA